MNWFKKFWQALREPTSTASTPTPKVAVQGPSSFTPCEPADIGNFTPRATQALALARKEAARLNHNFLGTEHLLLGLIKLGQGVHVNVLAKLGVDLESVRNEIERLVGTGPDQKMSETIPYTPRVKKTIALAQKEARALHHTYVGTEHLLLGLLREGDGVAAKVLRALEVDLEKTRAEILRELDPNFETERSDNLNPPPKNAPAMQTLPDPEPASGQPKPVGTAKRYDVYCTERNTELVVYRNALFKGAQTLFQSSLRDSTWQFIELEQADGQTIFISRFSIIKFCEPGTTPGGETVSTPKD